MAIDPVRIVLVTAEAGEDEQAARQIVLDLCRDDSTGSSSGPFPAFGRIGDFRRPETLFPFTLMMDGRLDMGAHASEAARQDRLDIRGARLAVGETVTLTGADGETACLIRSVTALAG